MDGTELDIFLHTAQLTYTETKKHLTDFTDNSTTV